jgi:triacylglycerol esterase/lipase EstA (alpha/beta hydrolase family)
VPRTFRTAAAVMSVAAVLVAAGPLLPASAGADPPAYRPPVEAPVVSDFDLPPEPWMAGNRGIDYDPAPGTPVLAAADGTVAFAGPVGGALHVTIRHPDGLRTSYSFLAEVTVVAGTRVRQGRPVGVAGGPFHFGVRDPADRYLDPALLLAGELVPDAVLVPGTAEGADPLAERRSLLATLTATGAAASAWAVGAWAATTTRTVDTVVLGNLAGVAWAAWRGCTPSWAAVPSHDGRRVAVVVSGHGTHSGGSSAWEIPTDQLGYAAGDVVRFSYAGGRSPDPRVAHRPGASGLDGLPTRAFDASDSQQALEDSAARLAELLAEVAARAPGVPIDVLAHSQGGVVSRLAIAGAADAGTLPGAVETLVTLGSPHGGAPLADLVVELETSDRGRRLLAEASSRLDLGDLDPAAPAARQLQRGSTVLAGRADQPLPAHVRFTSVGARWDLTVPAHQTEDAAARTVIVDAGVADAHGAITSDPAAVREIGLAVAGLAPGCESPGEVVTDLYGSSAVLALENHAAGAAAAGTLVVDAVGS